MDQTVHFGAMAAGNSGTLKRLRNELIKPWEPWAEEHEIQSELQTILFSTRLAEAADVGAANDIAKLLLGRINGIYKTVRGHVPIKFSGLVRFEPGQAPMLMTIGEANITLASATAGEGWVAPNPPVAPSPLQRDLYLASVDSKFDDLLSYAARCEDWFDVYKAIEAASDIAGGEHKLLKALGSTGPSVKDMKNTANFHRHYKTYNPPGHTKLHECPGLVGRMIEVVASMLTIKYPAMPSQGGRDG